MSHVMYQTLGRCSACPDLHKCVPPDGPMYIGEPLFVGEAPGYDEDKKGLPFVGKTGRELNEHYLPLAGLRREDTNISNAIKCLPDRPKGKLDLTREKDKQLLETCAEHFLYREIETLQPSILIPMGSFACYAIDPDINLELHHGMPLETRLGMTFPMYHPSQGIHEPKKMLLIRNDWIRLRRFLRGTLSSPLDGYTQPDYREANERDISDISPTIPLAADTESSVSCGPFYLTYSQQAGHARLIRASDSYLLGKFQEKLDKWESNIYFHNWPYDWTVVENMGLRFPIPKVVDTMMMVYHLGNMAQGLKSLAYRQLGMEMQDFEDLVKPYSLARIFQYYVKAREIDWPKPEEKMIKKDGLWKVYKPQGLNTKLKRLFTDISKNPDKDLLAVWDNWDMHHEEIEAQLGPYIGLDIADVPFEKSLYYACRDSDAVIRLLPKLLKMKEKAMTGIVQEQWDA